MSKPHQKSIRKYFDALAPGYRSRFDHPFLHYFFQQRLEAALNALPAPPASLLDIGAGTGSLYDAIRDRQWTTEYYGTDLSAAMLSESRIPANRQFVGTLPDLPLPLARFSAVFLLGVSTYLTQTELQWHLDWIGSHLEPEGYCCITFTHRKSLDFRIRRIFRRLIPAKLLSRRVLGQAFSVQAYVPADITALAPSLRLVQIQWLNQTLPPFNRWLPRLAVWLAPQLHRFLPSSFLPLFSSDFLLVFRKDR
jgi:SAM-dependent methyltransferase